MSQKKATAKKAVARKDMTKAQWTWKEMKRNWIGYVMIAPFVIVFTLLTIITLLTSMVIRFIQFNML